MLTHLRHTLRQLARSPGFTVTALVTLAICLGANLAIFAVVDAVLVRPLPFPHSERLVSVYNAYPGAGVPRAAASIPNYFDRRHAIRAFASVSMYREENLAVGGTASPDRVPVMYITPEFFQTLGVPLARGHMFSDAEMAYGPDQVAVLTDGFWRAHFQADPKVVGRTFLNDDLPVVVIGVLPRGFRFLSSEAQFYRPLSHSPDDRKATNRHTNGYSMIARLAPGVSLAEAQAQMDAFNAGQLASDPFKGLIKAAGYHTTVAFLHDDYVRSARPMLLLLQCGVAVLLVIGTVNLANLLLVRASGRAKELAVRQALGAGWRHIARETLVETTLLALGGGLCGLLLGALGIDLLRRLGTDKLPLGTSVEFDGRVAAASLIAALGVSLLLALPILWFNLRSRLTAGLQAEGRGATSGRAAQGLRHAFIVAQVALAFVLLAGAGLLGLSLRRVLQTPTGFHPDNILAGQITLPWKNYKDDASHRAFVRRLLPAIRVLPGISFAAVVNGLPFGGGVSDNAVAIEGTASKSDAAVRAHYIVSASSDYWKAMGIPLRRGRLLAEADDNAKAARVCVVDQSFARRYWPGRDPLGRRLDIGPISEAKDALTIVGVVADVKQNELAEAVGHGSVYVPYSKFSAGSFTLVVRTALPPLAVASSLRKAVFQLDPELPIDDLRPMQARIDDSLMARRSPAVLAGIFAGVALLLAAVGTYGVLAYAVGQRRREIGVRMALGAQPRDVLMQFLRLGGRLGLAGLVLGVPCAWLAGRAMRSLLFGVGAFPAGIFAATAVVLIGVVLLAVLLPSQRAARVDPSEALRTE